MASSQLGLVDWLDWLVIKWLVITLELITIVFDGTIIDSDYRTPTLDYKPSEMRYKVRYVLKSQPPNHRKLFQRY